MRGRKKGPVFLMVVEFRQENFNLFLREAELYLNGYTNVEYCLWIDLSIENGVPIMRIILSGQSTILRIFKMMKKKRLLKKKADLINFPGKCEKVPNRPKPFRNV